MSIGDVLTTLGTRAGLKIRPAGHSPRRGLVTGSTRVGNPDAVAEKQGGWAKGSKAMRGYREGGTGAGMSPACAGWRWGCDAEHGVGAQACSSYPSDGLRLVRVLQRVTSAAC